MGEKELEWTQEDEDALSSTAKPAEEKVTVEMLRAAHRRYEFSVDGTLYRWSGTKMHSGAVLRALGWKGFAYSVKVHNLSNLCLLFF
jgi:hypothetical protein